MTFPLKVQVLEVKQPLGNFYCASISAKNLLEVCFSDKMQANLNANDVIELQGTQRAIGETRLKQISEYINRSDSAFPNSIILAANYDVTGNTLDDLEDKDRWEIIEEDGSLYLNIPSPRKLAAIIDGQHRLFAFAKADKSRIDMDLLCSIYLDLPKAYQAQIFAVINSTQRAVNKSLTYELYGYNIDEESSSIWSPDKLAVYISRNLNIDPESPFKSRIRIAPIIGDNLKEKLVAKNWKVSTAVVVEGILKLISTNPRRDSNDLFKTSDSNRSNLMKDNSPLRNLYLSGNDGVLYRLLINYFKACENIFWNQAPEESFITKTIGIQALFDILKLISNKAVYTDQKISIAYFESILHNAREIDFSKTEYTQASAAGRRKIRDAIQEACNISKKPD